MAFELLRREWLHGETPASGLQAVARRVLACALCRFASPSLLIQGHMVSLAPPSARGVAPNYSRKHSSPSCLPLTD